MSLNEDKGELITTTRSGREVFEQKRALYTEPDESVNTLCEICKSIKISTSPDEIIAIGAGIGGGFTNTQELHVMKYKEAMRTKDKNQWIKAVQEELDRFKRHDVFEVVKLQDVPDETTLLTTTWAMKKKSNGQFRARLNMRGFEQQDGDHYDSASISSPVTNDVSIRVLLTIMLMANMNAYIVDVQGAFLHGEFDNGEILYCKIPEGFRDAYDPTVERWKLLKTAYGLKQAARMFWNKIVKVMNQMGFTRSVGDPCIYWKWTKRGLLIWVSWIDDMLCIGHPEDVEESKNEFMRIFKCDDVGAVSYTHLTLPTRDDV